MSDVSTITKADGLRALAGLLDDGLPAPSRITLTPTGRWAPHLDIRSTVDLQIVAGLADGNVALTWTVLDGAFTGRRVEGWRMAATSGPLHLTGFVYRSSLSAEDLDGLDGVVLAYDASDAETLGVPA